MKYTIDILNESKIRVAELTGMTSARLHERVNVPSTLTVETTDAEKWGYVLPGKSFLRVRRAPETAGEAFRVIEIRKGRVRERPSLTVTARHLIGDAADELFAGAVDCVNHTPRELAERVLAHSAFSPGTIEPEGSVPFARFEYESVLDCLLRICGLTGGELELDEDAGEISIRSRIGTDDGAVFRYGLNLTAASRTLSIARLANRVYGAGGGNPLLDLRGATASGGLAYVEDADSIAAWGLHETACDEPTLEAVENLVSAPALDGVYTGGLCAGWTNLGATVSRNADPAYYLYGRASQRVQTAADGQGIYQDVAVTAGKTYSLLANVIIAAGTVRVRVEDGTAVYRRPEAMTGTGLATIRIENWKALTSTARVAFVQEGTEAADFSVDSVQIAEGARVMPFTIGRSADTLWDCSVELLAARKDPEITYAVNLVDRSGDRGMERAPVRFSLGDTVTVIDPTLDLTVRTRVMEREADLLRPSRVSVRLDTPSRGLADVLSAIREARDKGIRQTRAALAESSAAAETGSTRLGFCNQSFRFYGTLTATGWNSLSWSAGTLRTGDCWFSITAGSVSGLPGNTTCYFYFDRAAPATFGFTTSGAEAEAEDRILLFAVTTTVSPDMCKIHTLGIVKV